MSDKRFFSMCALGLLSALTCFLHHPEAGVFPAFMFLLLGFDAIATEAATAAETTEIGSVHEGAGRNGIAQHKGG